MLTLPPSDQGGQAMKTRRVAIYLRVSTVDQNTDNQERYGRLPSAPAGT
jgi:predicted site-specific integrase-resolvase